MSTRWKSLLVIVALGVCFGTVAWAQRTSAPAPTPAQAQASDDEEEAFDDKLRQFGYWSGAAFSCVGEARQAEVERKVLETYNGIARLFGTDRAFFYAAAFGTGTTHKVDPAKCPEFLDKFEQATVVRSGRK